LTEVLYRRKLPEMSEQLYDNWQKCGVQELAGIWFAWTLETTWIPWTFPTFELMPHLLPKQISCLWSHIFKIEGHHLLESHQALIWCIWRLLLVVEDDT
jgi:hypothetical protein